MLLFYHNIAVRVKYGNDIALCVAAVKDVAVWGKFTWYVLP